MARQTTTLLMTLYQQKKPYQVLLFSFGWPRLRQSSTAAPPPFPAKQQVSSSKVVNRVDRECEGFLPWLERKAGVQISSNMLYIGRSAYGRSLFASKSIQTGDCILKVPYNVQIAPDCLFPNLRKLLDSEVDNVAKLAVVILVEQKIGQESEWAPYISCLPQWPEMHSTIFWSECELDMICQSSVYQETIRQKAQIEKDFLIIKQALECIPEIQGSITLKDFMHAYALVVSRAWGSSKGASLIPFADFLNHDGVSEAFVLNDDDRQVSEVIADRNYAPHEEVLIRYGKFSNATLLLEFGFTLSNNMHDQVQIQINLPDHDLLCETKMEILQRHHLPAIKDTNGFKLSGESFLINLASRVFWLKACWFTAVTKSSMRIMLTTEDFLTTTPRREVRSAGGKGKGLPQSLRAFARVQTCTSPQDLRDLIVEASQKDGRLARCPLKDSSKEILAHEILLSYFTQLIEKRKKSIELLQPVCSTPAPEKFALRKQMAVDLLMGEFRILESASAWLKNYCATLS